MKLDEFMQNTPALSGYDPYTVRILKPGVWLIEDATESRSCAYLVEGATSAVLIDTGDECGGDIFAVADRLTRLPWKLIVTHGHPDHAAFLDHIDEFYMSEKDIPLLQTFSEADVANALKCKKIDESTVFDLGGGVVIHTVEVEGHSPGSVIFIDAYHGFVYSGDAFGSGEGVWMQTPMGFTMSQYRRAILHALEAIDQYFPDGDFAMLPGHVYQLFIGVPGYVPNPPCRALVEDMATLCAQAIAHNAQEVSPKPYDTAFTEEPVVRILYQRASMVCLRSRFE